MNRLLLAGAGGHGRVVAGVAEDAGYTEIAFTDARFPELQENGAWPVVSSDMKPTEGSDFFVSIGSNGRRASTDQGLEYPSMPILAHPNSTISRHANIGPGTAVVAGAVINGFARLGRCCIINTSCSVDHDCVLGDYVHISPGAHLAGQVRVGDRSWIGIGAVVREGITIGSDVVVAAGAVVVSDVADGQTVTGVPARPTERV